MARKGTKNIQATKTVVSGIEFASKFEAERYKELCLLERGGEIFHLRTHVSFPLQNEHVAIRELRGDKVRTYTADFTYVEPKKNAKDTEEKFQRVAEDTKGRTTPVASLRMSVFKALYPEVELRVIKQNKRKKRVAREHE